MAENPHQWQLFLGSDTNKDRFEEKQNRLCEIRDDLETVGLYSEALSRAISANYNRRDRDLPDLSIELEFETYE